MTQMTKLLLERYQSKRSEAAPARPTASSRESDVQAQRRSYQHAAAVLHCFVPEDLLPLAGDSPHGNPRLVLFDDIVRVSGGWSEQLFTLKTEVRRKALKELATRDAMLHALQSNPARRLTALQDMWESYLRTGSLPAPESIGYQQLAWLCEILGWLNGLDGSVPEQAHVLDLVRRRSVLQSFEHLMIENFTGRDRELATLREHVGVLPAATGLQAMQRQLNQWMSLERKPVLAIHGPGGIGKSALVGRMLWEHAGIEGRVRIPFAYLAFDQPTLRVETPFTLLVEAAAQFEQQFPEHSSAVAKFRDDVRRFRDARGASGSRRQQYRSRNVRIATVQDMDRQLYLEFAKLLEQVAGSTVSKEISRVPVLIVLDTFEEVQYRDREGLAGLWRMLDILHEAYPPLRIVISGRGSVSELGMSPRNLREVALRELDVEDSATLLQRLGVSPPEVARAIARQVGGNPLSLRLAANVVTSDPQAAGARGIADLATRKWLVFQIDEQLIQGQLYRRILDHIHDENVRKLAHPGMVLRRVTPEVILEVLAPLFLTSVTEPEHAMGIFEQLRREHALVTSDVDGALVYRPEIRCAMVRLLEQDRYKEVRDLRRAAIYYYSGKDDLAARAEEMYHRLALGEDEFLELDSRWMPGIESSIISSVEEYSDRVKVWLASRMDLEVPRSVYANADTAEWERNITRKVQRALSELQLDGALQLLGERADRTEASPLFALETKAHMLRDDPEHAAAILERGIARVSDSTNRGRLAELYWLQSQVKLLRGDPAGADESLERAGRAVEHAVNPLAFMHILCHRLLLRREHPGKYSQSAAKLRSWLSGVCERIDESMAYSAGYVIALALDVLDGEFPTTATRLESLIGPAMPAASGDALTSENLQGLEEYREPWERQADPAPEAAA